MITLTKTFILGKVRISAATAKFKPPIQGDAQEEPRTQDNVGPEHLSQSVSVAIPLPGSKSVSAPVASTSPSQSIQSFNSQFLPSDSRASMSTTTSMPSLSSASSTTSASSHMTSLPDSMMNIPASVLAQLAQQFGSQTEKKSEDHRSRDITDQSPRYVVSEESWKHQAQARAILGNLMGPNGEQLTSTDPYNTTVFVGGLSPLISEDTLRTFFNPFGEIHYVSPSFISESPILIALIGQSSCWKTLWFRAVCA